MTHMRVTHGLTTLAGLYTLYNQSVKFRRRRLVTVLMAEQLARPKRRHVNAEHAPEQRPRYVVKAVASGVARAACQPMPTLMTVRHRPASATEHVSTELHHVSFIARGQIITEMLTAT